MPPTNARRRLSLLGRLDAACWVRATQTGEDDAPRDASEASENAGRVANHAKAVIRPVAPGCRDQAERDGRRYAQREAAERAAAQ